MSVPSSSSNNISDNNKLGGTSPSPIEGIEGVPGPSSLGPMHAVLPQDEESEDYGDEGDEEDEDSSEAESGVSPFVQVYSVFSNNEANNRTVVNLSFYSTL